MDGPLRAEQHARIDLGHIREHAQAFAEQAPPLTAEQRARLTALLRATAETQQGVGGAA